MRDLVLREALKDLANEAGERFRELVRSGREIPYEVREPGEGSPFCHYAPLTARFIHDHSSLVASLSAYGPAKAAIVASDSALPYLEQLGLDTSVPAGRMAEDAVIVFLCRLWQGSTDFSLEPSRIEAALCELEDCAEADAGEVEVVVPLLGLQMEVSRLELGGASLVRADVVEAPPEATDTSGSGRAQWEPQFLAYARCRLSDLVVDETEEGTTDVAAPVAQRFHTSITALRLFKSGGVGLGPHGWTRTGGGRWRRIATGAGRARPGGYRLTDSELGELSAFARAAEAGRPTANLVRAISRFEAGIERQAPLDALNDHLLALRFLLEGDGPAGTGLPMRVAALCAPPSGRDEVKRTIELALALERELWSGDPAPAGDGRSPVQIASELEDLLRAILRDAVCGHLGGDLRVAADEILLADGLAAGEGDVSQRGETSEWQPRMTDEIDEIDIDEDAVISGQLTIDEVDEEEVEPEVMDIEDIERIEHEVGEESRIHRRERDESPQLVNDGWTPFVPTTEERPPEPDSASEPSPVHRLPTPPAKPSDEVESIDTRVQRQPRERIVDRTQAQADDWLADADGSGATLDFPERGPAMRLLDQRPEEREAMRQRVSTLFPVPDTVDWSVGELDYDRRNRADLGAQPGA